MTSQDAIAILSKLQDFHSSDARISMALDVAMASIVACNLIAKDTEAMLRKAAELREDGT